MQIIDPTATPDTDASTSSGQKLYGIAKYLNNGKILGWRVLIRRRGTWVSRFFSIKECGSMDRALEAAIAFRDEVHQEFAPLTKQEHCATLRSTNTSGVPGVFRTKGGEWQAYRQMPDGRRKKRGFSVNLYGEEEAFRRAVEARRQLLLQTQGNALYHPEMRDDEKPEPASAPELVRLPHKNAPVKRPYAHQPTCDVTGVYLLHDKVLRSSGVTETVIYWTAEIMKPNGLPKRRFFSVTRYGEEEAKRKAIEQRLRWDEEYGKAASE